MTAAQPRVWLVSAGWGLAILTLINLFNYLDRFVVASLFESLKHSTLALSDRQLGFADERASCSSTCCPRRCSARSATGAPGRA